MPSSLSLPDTLTAPLQRLALRYRQSPLPRFFEWWSGELRSLLPGRWRALLDVEAARLLLRLETDGSLLVSRRERSGLHELGRIDADEAEPAAAVARLAGHGEDGMRRILLLPPSQVLRRNLTLPAAAAERLRAVVGFELDRQTPFKPEQVHFDARILGRDAPGKTIEVEFALVPRPVFDEQLQRIGALADTLDAVDVADADGAPSGFNLLPAERRVARRNLRLWINLSLVALGIVLLWFAAGQILENRREAVAELDAAVERQRAEARAVNQLRETLQDAVEGANFLAVRRAEQPLMIELLEELTRLLPDNTYLERLSYSDGQLNITGQSSAAAQLIKSLQGSERLHDPSLSGSVQPDARTGKDRFTISAGFGPPQEAVR